MYGNPTASAQSNTELEAANLLNTYLTIQLHTILGCG